MSNEIPAPAALIRCVDAVLNAAVNDLACVTGQKHLTIVVYDETGEPIHIGSDCQVSDPEEFVRRLKPPSALLRKETIAAFDGELSERAPTREN